MQQGKTIITIALSRHERRFLFLSIGSGTIALFSLAMLRHGMLASNLWDLGIFDQAVYLLSQGKPPIVTTLGFHILGDHAAFMLYPIAMLYWIWPTVAWLFLLQAGSLAFGAMPVYLLARHHGLAESWSRVMVLCYLAYPSLFNVNMFDFHPEVMALPALLWASYAAVSGRTWQMFLALCLALSCKAVLSFTVASFGLWLLIRREWRLGLAVVFLGGLWYIWTAYYVIPTFSGAAPSAIGRYSTLGANLNEIAWNLLTHPEILITQITHPGSLKYYLVLLFPVILGLNWRHLLWVVPGLGMLILNVLSGSPEQRSLVYQYSLPIFPFIIAWLIRSISDITRLGSRPWLTPRLMTIWSVASFLALAKFGYFFTNWQANLSNRSDVMHAVSLIRGNGGVLTASHLASHLAHRARIDMTNADISADRVPFNLYEYVLLDFEHPGWMSSRAFSERLCERLRREPDFRVIYEKSGVVLFARNTELPRSQEL